MHYLWFVLEIAVAFAYKTSKINNSNTSSDSNEDNKEKFFSLLFWITSQIHPKLREFLRLILVLCTIPYGIFYGVNDKSLLNAIIVPNGQVSLGLFVRT